MGYFSTAIIEALELIVQFDNDVYQIVFISLKISLIASAVAGVIGISSGIWIAVNEFWGKQFIQQLLNTLMAMPTVMIGLILYGLLSRRGLFGDFGLLYSETAVILGQTCLIIPIVMNMTLVAVQSADSRLLLTLKTLGANQYQLIFPVLSECRLALLATLMTGFGRAIGEVGAAMMLGGNIQGSTRTMTTAIALETSKGDFELGLALGILLLLIAFMVNFLLQCLKK